MADYETVVLQVSLAYSSLIADLCLELRSLNPFPVFFSLASAGRRTICAMSSQGHKSLSACQWPTVIITLSYIIVRICEESTDVFKFRK